MMFRTPIFALCAAAMTFAAQGVVSITVNATVDSRIDSVSVKAGSQTMTLAKNGSGTWTGWNVGTAYTPTFTGVATGYSGRWSVKTNGVVALSGGAGNNITIPLTSYSGCALSFYGQPNTYTVTLNREGGSGGSSSVTATYDAAMPAITKPTRTGYSFGGYYTGQNGSGTQYYTAAGASARTWNIAANNTLYAKWTANSYTVTLKANNNQSLWPLVNAKFPDGTANDKTFPATYGQKYPTLVSGVPSSPGYTFKNWYDATSNRHFRDGVQLNDLTVEITANSAFWAQWTANRYTVTLRANNNQQIWPLINATFPDGTSNDKTFQATYGQKYPTLGSGVPSSPGYTFKNWYDATSNTHFRDGVQLNDLTVAITSSRVFFAQWTTNTYTVTLDRQSGSGGSSSVTATYGQAMPSIVVPTRTGYTFGGYYTGQNGSGTQYYTGTGASAKPWGIDTATPKLYAKWTPKTYTVTLVTYGGTLKNGWTSPTNYTVGVGLTLPTSTDVEYANHTFVAWYDNESYDAAGRVTSIPATETGDKTFYAKWNDRVYKVSFDANGGTGRGEQDLSMVNSDQLKTIAELRITAPQGYTFNAWNTAQDGSGDSYADGAVIYNNLTNVANATVTLYAQWTPNPYEVAFDPNGADGGETMDNQAFVYDVTQALDHVEFTYTGYAFRGWSSTTNRPSTFIPDGAEVVNLATGGVATLYANWTGIVYTVTFDANGGAGEMDPLICTYDVPTNLPACTFTRDGWGFKEWTNAVGEVFADHARVTNLTATAETTLFACWTGVTYAVTLDASRDSRGIGVMTNGAGEAVSVLTNRYTVGDAWNLPAPTNVNENLKFAGWKYGDNQTAGGEVPPPSSGSTNLVADWTWVTDDLAAAVDAPELGFRTFGTVGKLGNPAGADINSYAAAWFAQTNFVDASTNAVQSGALPVNADEGHVGQIFVSWLTTTVEGKGVLSFSWKCAARPLEEGYTQSGWCGDTFRFGRYEGEDGFTNLVVALQGNADWRRVTYTNDIDGPVTFAWAFTYEDYGANNGGGTGWVDRVTWTPDGSASGDVTSEHSVPYSWLCTKLGASSTATAEEFEELAEGKSPNGKVWSDGTSVYVWQDYWADTDPNDPNDLFRANIVVSNNVPYISWHPDLSVTGDPKRVYHVLCAPTPSAREWVVWPGPGDSGASTNRFFKVELDWEESQKN